MKVARVNARRLPTLSSPSGVGGGTALPALDDLTDVDTSGVGIGDTIVWDGSEWIPGTGSTGTSIYFNVVDYGAVGDGTTDDTSAFAAAITALLANEGGTLYVPATPDFYKITSVLNIHPASALQFGAVTVLGDGEGSIVKMTTTATNLFDLTNNADGARFVGIQLLGPNSGASGDGIVSTKTVNTESVRIKNFVNGLHMGSGSFYSVNHGSLFGENSAAQVLLDNGCNNARFTSCYTFGGTHGYRIKGSQGTKIIGGSVESSSTFGILVDTDGAQTTDGTYIAGVYFENNGSASIYVGDTASVRSTTIIGCFFTSPQTGYFIDVEAADYNTIGSCHFLGSPGSGDIRLQTGITHAVQWNNRPSGVGNTYTSTPIILENLGTASFATPAIVLGTAAAAGAASTVIRSDSTIVAFDATVPTTQAFSDAAATGSAAVAARRDHLHGMPASPSVSGGTLVIASSHSTPLIFDDLVQTSAGDDLVYTSS